MRKKLNKELARRALFALLKAEKEHKKKSLESNSKKKVSRKIENKDADRIYGYQFTDFDVTVFKKPKKK